MNPFQTDVVSGIHSTLTTGRRHAPPVQAFNERGMVIPPDPKPKPATDPDLIGNVIVKFISSGAFGNCFKLQKHQSTYSANMYITQSPTQNCQVSSVGSIESMFTLTIKKDECQAILRKCYSHVGYGIDKLVMLDVKEKYINVVETCFNVILKSPYTSTNKSGMCLFLVKLD